jgi:uncharacterized RDD family membrane protein YckC
MSEFGSPTSSGVAAGARANFGQRLGAYLVDVVLIWIVYGIFWALANRTLAWFVGLVAGLAYFTYFEGGPTGQTLGKRMVGIRVYDFAQGGPIGYGRGVLRYIGRLISGIPCALGYFWMLWDKEQQTWHDKIATTVVVPTSDYPV